MANKQELRARMEAARAALDADKRRLFAQAICGRAVTCILEPLAEQAGRPLCVAGYMPFRSEADILPIFEWCWARGYTTLFPRVDRHSRRMTFHPIKAMDELESGAWGIREPAAKIPEWGDIGAIDLVIVPGIGFDRDGGRLGYGGGYYDRWFAELDAKGIRHPLKFALAYELQIVNDLPMDPHDFRIDGFVTENRFVQFS